jgi:hypothetical protein
VWSCFSNKQEARHEGEVRRKDSHDGRRTPDERDLQDVLATKPDFRTTPSELEGTHNKKGMETLVLRTGDIDACIDVDANPSYNAWKKHVSKALQGLAQRDFLKDYKDHKKLAVLNLLKEAPSLEGWVGNHPLDSTSALRLKLRLGTTGLQADPARGKAADRSCKSCDQGLDETTEHFSLHSRHCAAYDHVRREAILGLPEEEQDLMLSSQPGGYDPARPQCDLR